ncbi:MAG: hypothetical protein EOP50_09230 [Sphingobacteriales bacterium]|nr:MAG: hypothetical protein EOP50_09230 [Sphingobacteriales bacterium]
MASGQGQTPRSDAARDASRRNGAKSNGPRTAAGKAASAMNAMKHGLRARQSLRREDLPEWIKDIEAGLLHNFEPLSAYQEEHLTRLISVLVQIDRVDGLITTEFGQLFAAFDCDGLSNGQETPASDAAWMDASDLRKLFAYRKRFRARRDMCLKRILRPTQM